MPNVLWYKHISILINSIQQLFVRFLGNSAKFQAIIMLALCDFIFVVEIFTTSKLISNKYHVLLLILLDI